MFVLVGPRVRDLAPHLINGWKDVVESGPARIQLVAATEAGCEQLPRPATLGVSLPEVVPPSRGGKWRPPLEERT